ncbi:MAG: MFS transporter [Dehalococcoidia bacterium]
MPAIPQRRLIWTGYLGFALIGVYVTAIGPGLPGLAARTHIPLSQAGTLLTALFAGGLITSAAAGHAMDRYGRKPLLIAGSLVNALGCLLLPLARSWPEALVCGVLLGIGDSILVVGWQVVFVDLHPEASGAALSRLNVYFGLGALLGPALAAASIWVVGDFRYALWCAAAGQCLTALITLRSLDERRLSKAGAAVDQGFRQVLRLPLLQVLFALLALYVALEAGLGAWTYSYLHAMQTYSVGFSSAVASGYWLALTAGRALSPFALRRLDDRALLVWSCGFAALGGLLLTIAADRAAVAAPLILLEGLAFGPIWPMTLAVATTARPRAAGAVSGLLATAGSVGGIFGPWLQGVLFGAGVYQGMAFVLAGAGVMALLALVALRSGSVAPALDTAELSG